MSNNGTTAAAKRARLREGSTPAPPLDRSPAAAMARLRRFDAGEALDAVYPNEGVCDRSLVQGQDTGVLAQAYADEHPADDAEPATLAWLAEWSGVAAAPGGELLVPVCGAGDGEANQLVVCPDLTLALECRDVAGSLDIVSLGTRSTRGQFRRLLDALGLQTP